MLKNQDVIFDARLLEVPLLNISEVAGEKKHANTSITQESLNGYTTPELQKQDEYNSVNLTAEAKNIIALYKEIDRDNLRNSGQQTIKVGETLGAVTFAYERARNAIDYKGEHLLCRNAIERILRRQLWINPHLDTEDISKILIKELIWGKYLPNDSVPKNKIIEVAKVIKKYGLIIKTPPKNSERIKKADWKNWLINIESCEIEETVDSNLQCVYVYINSIYSWICKNYAWEGDITSEEKDIQLSIAVQKTFAKSDLARIRYFLLQRRFPDWKDMDGVDLASQSDDIYKRLVSIEKSFKNPIQNRLYRYIQKIVTPFTILKEITDANSTRVEQLLSDDKMVEEQIEKETKDRFDRIRKTVRRGIVRSIIYIFITKIFVVLLVEIPFELFYYGSINFMSLGINMILPPVLMLTIVPTVKSPSDMVVGKISRRIKSFIRPDNDITQSTFNLNPVKRTGLLQLIFTLAYSLVLLMIVFGIINVLDFLHFNVVSIAIFFIFLSLVLLFGFRIRYTATELAFSDDKEGFLNHVVTIFSLPFLNFGNLLSKSLSKFNFLIILLDFIIEAPFKNVVGFYDEWSGFLKERREEFVEVPIN